jgi:hypothetical protein
MWNWGWAGWLLQACSLGWLLQAGLPHIAHKVLSSSTI